MIEQRPQHLNRLQRQTTYLERRFGNPDMVTQALVLAVTELLKTETPGDNLSPKLRIVAALQMDDSSAALETVDTLIDVARDDPAYKAIVSELVPAWRAYLERYNEDQDSPFSKLHWILP